MKKSLLKNGLYNVVGGSVRIGLAVLTIPLLIRLIGVEEYGLWTLASAVVGIVTLAEAGLSVTTTVFISQDLGKKDINALSQTLTVTFGAMLILATLSMIALLLSVQSIISLFTNLEQSQQLTVARALQFGSLVVWARLLQQILIGVEQAYQCYGLSNLFNTMQSLLLNVGMLAVVIWLGGRTVALMQWQAIVSVIILFSHVCVVRSLLKGTPLYPSWNKEKCFAVGKYSIITWFISLGSSLFSRIDRLIVGSVLGTQILGLYAAITDITANVNLFSSLPVQPLLPVLSHLIAQENIDLPKLQQQIKQAVQLNVMVAFGLGGTLITLSPFILNLVFSGETANKYILNFCIATIIYSLYSINAVGFFILLSTNAVKNCAIFILVSGCFSLVLILLGCYMFGLTGAILGNAGYIATLVINILAMKRLSIQKLLWIKWSLPIGLWFLIVILANIFLIHSEFRIIMFFIQTTIILLYFCAMNRNFFSRIISSI